MFDAWSQVLFSRTLSMGDLVTAQGRLAVYDGYLELQSELDEDWLKDTY
jgi:hypothetical protein